MKVTLKNIKISHSLSEETYAYTADLYIDGIKTARASNHGTGGADLYTPIDQDAGERLRKAEEHFRQKKVKLDGMEIEGSVELEVAQILEDHSRKQWLRGQFRTKVVFAAGGELLQIPAKPAERDRVVQHVKRKYPGCKVLNELPIDEAVKLSKAA